MYIKSLETSCGQRIGNNDYKVSQSENDYNIQYRKQPVWSKHADSNVPIRVSDKTHKDSVQAGVNINSDYRQV